MPWVSATACCSPCTGLPPPWMTAAGATVAATAFTCAARHARNAGVGHCAVGVVDEGLSRNRVTEEVENPVDHVGHFCGPCLCVLWSWVAGLPGELVTTLWSRRRLEKRGRNPSLGDCIPG